MTPTKRNSQIGVGKQFLVFAQNTSTIKMRCCSCKCDFEEIADLHVHLCNTEFNLVCPLCNNRAI